MYAKLAIIFFNSYNTVVNMKLSETDEDRLFWNNLIIFRALRVNGVNEKVPNSVSEEKFRRKNALEQFSRWHNVSQRLTC